MLSIVVYYTKCQLTYVSVADVFADMFRFKKKDGSQWITKWLK